ncbi:hypothetical protein ACOSQ2_019330 [Xanthoceras sorbifolium]
MGVPNGGEPIHMNGEHPSLNEWAYRFCFLLLGTLLAPGTSDFVSAELMIPPINLFYLHSLQWDPSIVDKSIPPIARWTSDKIKKMFNASQNPIPYICHHKQRPEWTRWVAAHVGG